MVVDFSPASIAVVVGNPRPASRTRRAAGTFALSLAPRLDTAWSPADASDLAAAPAADQFPATAAALAAADVVVVATPVYKASFTGLLKLFLDQLPAGALAGKVAVPVTVAGSAAHRNLADLHLRPVLGELGASLPVPAFLLEERDLAALPTLAEDWAARHAAVVRATVHALRPSAAVTR